jgi:hypothetical protein
LKVEEKRALGGLGGERNIHFPRNTLFFGEYLDLPVVSIYVVIALRIAVVASQSFGFAKVLKTLLVELVPNEWFVIAGLQHQDADGKKCSEE